MRSFSIIIAVSLGVVALLAWRGTEKANEGKYDERQLIARGKAGLHAYLALSAYLLASYVAGADGAWAEPSAEAAIGLYVGLGVFIVECIRCDAYFTVDQNAKSYAIVCAVCALAFGLLAIRRLRAGEMLADGLVTIKALTLVVAVWGLAISAAIVLRLWRAKREDEEDKEDDEA